MIKIKFPKSPTGMYKIFIKRFSSSGGKARAKILSKKRRIEIARNAGKAKGKSK